MTSLAAGTRRIVAAFKGNAGWADSTSTVTVVVSPVRYHLALGRLAGRGRRRTGRQGLRAASSPPPRRSASPGLQLSNLSCSGATTASMLTGGGCSYPEGNQTAAAEAFLRAHPGAVSFITIDIGANDVSGCVVSPDPTCASTRIASVQTNLTQILTRLHGRRPWRADRRHDLLQPVPRLLGGRRPGRRHLLERLGGHLQRRAVTTTYTAGGARVAPVDAAFGTADTAPDRAPTTA